MNEERECSKAQIHMATPPHNPVVRWRIAGFCANAVEAHTSSCPLSALHAWLTFDLKQTCSSLYTHDRQKDGDRDVLVAKCFLIHSFVEYSIGQSQHSIACYFYIADLWHSAPTA